MPKVRLTEQGDALEIGDGGEIIGGIDLRTQIQKLNGMSAVITDSGANHNIAASEAWAYLRMTGAGAKTVTFRPESVEALPDGFDIVICNAAESGNVTLVAGNGVTLNPPEGGTLVLEPDADTEGARGFVTVTRVSENVYNVTGDTTPA
jgi:hypothetical protein